MKTANYLVWGVMALLPVVAALAKESPEKMKQHVDAEYDFTFEYPANYRLKVLGKGGYLDFRDEQNRLVLQTSVEDDIFKHFIEESRSKKNLFHRFARQRIGVICSADGPDGTVYCSGIKQERTFTSNSGCPALEFLLEMTSEHYGEDGKKTVEITTVGPCYMVDLSRKDAPMILLVHPPHGELAAKDVRELELQIVNSIRLTPP
ncbi:MAG: hypothetical protein HY360_23720 [Verrucomicrobia bacterium]|nr:hypothetical protein [Verrucomicrobiota bacterium]